MKRTSAARRETSLAEIWKRGQFYGLMRAWSEAKIQGLTDFAAQLERMRADLDERPYGVDEGDWDLDAPSEPRPAAARPSRDSRIVASAFLAEFPSPSTDDLAWMLDRYRPCPAPRTNEARPQHTCTATGTTVDGRPLPPCPGCEWSFQNLVIHLPGECPESRPANALPDLLAKPACLWVTHQMQCGYASPDRAHSCTIEIGHLGVHVACDPMTGGVLDAWPASVIERPPPQAHAEPVHGTNVDVDRDIIRRLWLREYGWEPIPGADDKDVASLYVALDEARSDERGRAEKRMRSEPERCAPTSDWGCEARRLLGIARGVLDSIASGEGANEQAFDWEEFYASVKQQARLAFDETAMPRRCSETALVDELADLRQRIEKGRKKYPNGCTVLSLLDEAGEVAHAVNKYDSVDRAREEILDTASVAMRLYLGEVDRTLRIDGLQQVRAVDEKTIAPKGGNAP